MPITISVIEDDRDTRDHLVALINRDPALSCLASYASGEAAVHGFALQRSDVALVDINLPGITGIECVAQLKLQSPGLQILMLTTYEESDLIFQSLRAGAHGYVLKSVPHPELMRNIKEVFAGGAPISMQIARKVVGFFHQNAATGSDKDKLSRREHEILVLLARGYRYKEISDHLNIATSTVRTHLKHIYEKLHVQSRTEAAVKYLERN